MQCRESETSPHEAGAKGKRKLEDHKARGESAIPYEGQQTCGVGLPRLAKALGSSLAA